MDSSDKTLFGELLQRFRKRKGLTQHELADRIGTHRSTISFWERGFYRPETLATLHELVRVLGLDEEEKRLFFEAHIGTASILPFSNLPVERNPYFTGRDEVLDALHQKLSVGKYVALTQAISGLGGIGKTQIALEYAYRYRNSYHDILWTSADTHEALVASYETLARRLRLREREERDPNKVVAALKRWLAEHKGWLLVLDNVEELSLVNRFVPPDRQGAVVLTTRRQVTEPVAQAIEVDALSEEDGARFLLKRTRRLTLEGSLEDASAEDVTVAHSIARQLGRLPLALDQAGAYIEATRCSLSDYLLLFQSSRQRLLDERDAHADHPLSVTRTFTLVFEQLERSNASAAELLRACAFLAPEGIPETVFIEGAASLGPTFVSLASDPFQFNAAVKTLLSYSLLQRHTTTHTITIHRLVQAVLKGNMSEAAQRTWVARLIDAMTQLFPAEQETQADYWQVCEQLLPHALVCVTLSDQWGEEVPERATLMSHVATYLSRRVRFAEAESLYQRALRIWEHTLGPEHPLVAEALHGLAALHYKLDKHEQAESLYQRALRIREHALGPEHPLVATSLNEVAYLYKEQAKYEQAEPLFQRALRIQEHALGPEHPLVASSLNMLANLYLDQDKYGEAESLYQRALRIWEQHLGPEHPRVAALLNNLAELYRAQGKYEQAELLYQRALRIWEQVLGPEDPDVAFALHGLAELYRAQGKYEQAELLYRRALRIWEQAVPGHTEVAKLLTGLAELYRAQEQYEQAEPLYQRALHIWEQATPEHPQVAELLTGLAELYRAQGKYEQAKPLFQRALALRQQH